MRRTLALLVVLLVGPASAAGKKCDLSTDKGVRAVYKKVSGHALEGRACIERSSTFHGVVHVGSFADDRGCIWLDTLIGCHGGATTAEILATAGWKKADAKRRATLARAYVEEILGEQVLDKLEDADDLAFMDGNRTFAAPETTTSSDGGVTLRYWSSESAGMRGGMRYTLEETTIAADGTVSTHALDSFEGGQP